MELENFHMLLQNKAIIKFDDDFMFQINKVELKELQRCKNITSELWASGKGGRGN